MSKSYYTRKIKVKKTLVKSIQKRSSLVSNTTVKLLFRKFFRIIHLNGFSDEELWAKRSLIFYNIIESMTQLIYGIKRFGVQLILEQEVSFLNYKI